MEPGASPQVSRADRLVIIHHRDAEARRSRNQRFVLVLVVVLVLELVEGNSGKEQGCQLTCSAIRTRIEISDVGYPISILTNTGCARAHQALCNVSHIAVTSSRKARL